MKTIELQDEESWEIIIDDPTEKTKYTFSDKVYTKLETIFVFDLTNSAIDYPLVEGPFLNVPNLKALCFSGQGCRLVIQSLIENGILAPILESISFDSTQLRQFPNFIQEIKTLKYLSFRHEKISGLPPGLFDLINLQALQFQYDSGISVLPDEIKNLVNLVQFDLWGVTLEYLSPELFLLPKIQSINFAYSSYQPKKEVLNALKVFTKKGINRFSRWREY